MERNLGELPRFFFITTMAISIPEGLLQCFDIEVFLTIDRLWTLHDFRSWIRGNYREACWKIAKLPDGRSIDAHAECDSPAEPEDLGEDAQPRIFYTGTFITDYSYVFTH